MNPNWTKLASLFRTLTIIGISSFCGALALPLSVDGTLPVTWTAWKPILAVAASAAAVSEFIWIRTHVQQAAQAIGIATSDIGTPPAIKAALLKVGIGATLILSIFCVDCTPAQVAQAQVDTAQAIDLTNAVCALAPDSPVGQPFVTVVCTLVDGAEQLVSVVIGSLQMLEGDAATTASVNTSAIARVPVKQIQFNISTAISAKFLATHAAKK